QWQTSGNPLSPGYNAKFPHHWGFGVFGPPALGQVHTPKRGIENTSNNVLGINKWLNGWECGSLLFILLFLLTSRRFQLWDKILFAGIGSILVLYFGYFFQDLLFGPRFLFIIAPILLLFIVRSVLPEEESAFPSWRPYAFSLLAISQIIFFPLRLNDFVQLFNPALYPESVIEKNQRELKTP